MTATTYAQRLARNCYENMVPLPRRINTAPAHARGIQKAALTKGLRAVHALLAETYLLALQSPDVFHLAPYPDALPRAGGHYGGASRSFGRLAKLFFTIGMMGEPQHKGAKLSLAVPLDAFRAHCKHASITRLEQLLADVGVVGLQSAEVGQYLEVRFPSAPATALGLSVFAKAARPYAEDLRVPPLVFRRGDLRILATEDAAPRPPEVTIEDVTRPLDSRQANALRTLAAHVETLGYRPKLKCSGLGRGEWRGSYANSRLGKTLLGFHVEENELKVRLVFDTSPQIAPCVAKLPKRLKEAVLRAGKCRKCGRCESGPIVIAMGGEKRRLCQNFWLTLRDLTAAEVKHVQRLIEAQDQILRERAAG